MHLALKSAMSRIPYTNKVGETLSSIADTAAAYSLRALGGGDPTVARVRRSSDDAEKDFTASDMDSGSVADWVNGKQDTTLPCDVASAAAAYSLRSVNSNYTGSIVRARRSSDDAEKDFSDVSLIADWVNEDVVITNATFVNINGTYDTFSGSSSSGFTATNTASDGRALSNLTISTPQIGDKFRINYNLTLNSGSGIKFLLATSTGSNASNSVDVTSSGTGSIELTANNLDIATLRINAIGNVDFVVSDISVTAIQSSGYVTTWYDQSGNGNNATQITASSQPKIVDGGVLVSDGIDFDGVDDYFSLDTEPNFSGRPCSIFTAQEATTRSILGEDSNRRLHFATSSVLFYLSGLQINETYPSVNSTGLNVFSAIHDGTAIAPNFQAHANGQASTTGDGNQGSPMASSPISFVGRNVGNSIVSYFNKSVSEIIIYDSDQSANRFKIESNINNHYGLYTNANDGFVTTWYDQSDNSNDATQSVAASQPKIVDGGVLVSDGIKFDGVDDFLACAPELTQPAHVFANYQAITGDSPIMGASTNSMGFNRRINDEYLVAAGTALAGGTHPSTPVVASVLFNGANSKGHWNSVEILNGDAGNYSNVEYIGRNIYADFDGSISEIIIYNSDQSANRAAIETNINNYYDIY